MLYLLGGFAILCGLLLLGYLFVNADPARLARVVKWTAIVAAVLVVIALVWSERFAMFLAPGADAEAIKAAHHRLMKQLHPDHGGTDYLATKINRARDVLLRH